MELLDSFDISSIITQLIYPGSVSFPILSETTRANLLIEALSYPYQKRENVVGPAKVKQELSAFEEFSSDSQFFVLRDLFQDLLKAKMKQYSLSGGLFNTPLQFNDLSLQKYPPHSLGITPHMDSRTRINLVCIFLLKGSGRFCLCEDRNGKNPVELDTTPGNVILMSALGFRGANFRPFHFVTDIKGLRITFGLRQKIAS